MSSFLNTISLFRVVSIEIGDYREYEGNLSNGFRDLKLFNEKGEVFTITCHIGEPRVFSNGDPKTPVSLRGIIELN
jgi:hypothetical protein